MLRLVPKKAGRELLGNEVGVLEVKRVARSDGLVELVVVELVEVDEAEVDASAEVEETEEPPTEG